MVPPKFNICLKRNPIHNLFLHFSTKNSSSLISANGIQSWCQSHVFWALPVFHLLSILFPSCCCYCCKMPSALITSLLRLLPSLPNWFRSSSIFLFQSFAQTCQISIPADYLLKISFLCSKIFGFPLPSK